MSREYALRDLIAASDAGEWGSDPTDQDSVGVLRAGNLCNDGTLDLSDLAMRGIPARKREKLRLIEGDIVLERSGGSDNRPVGRVAFVTRDTGLVFTNFLHRLRANRDLVEPEFLFYLLLHLHQEGRTNALQTQTTGIRNLMFDRYLAQVFRIPDLGVQRRLLHGLRRVSALVARLRELHSAKRALKCALLHELLTGQRRFTEFGPPSQGGSAPHGWATRSFAELGRIVSGGTPSTTEPAYWGGGIAWCTPTDVTRLRGPDITVTERTITDSGVAASSVEVLPVGSVIVCTRATVGACAINRVPMATNQGFKSIVPSKGMSPEFLYYLVCAHEKELVRRAAGSTFLEISGKSFASISVPVPTDLREQERIASTLLKLDAEIMTSERLRETYEALKRTLMHRLLSGDRPLPALAPPPELAHA